MTEFDQHAGSEFEDPYAPATHSVNGDDTFPGPAGQLTPEQLRFVERFYHAVEPTARDTIKTWKADSEQFQETLGDGYLGLVKAAVDYDPRKVSPEATTSGEYFIKSIKGRILNGLRARLGRDENGRIRRLKPGVMYGTADSLEETVASEYGQDLKRIDTIADPRAEKALYDRVDLKTKFQQLLTGLSLRDREILVRRVLLDQTLSEIGKQVGHSKVHIHRILKRILSETEEDEGTQP